MKDYSTQLYGTLPPPQNSCILLQLFQNQMKQRARAFRDWPQKTCMDGDYYNARLDHDYTTGRDITGEWAPVPSEEPRDRFNAPIVGGPQLLVNQLDKALEEEVKP